MFNGLHEMNASSADLASGALTEEGTYRFPSFDANAACTIGLSLRKRFRASSRHAKGKGLAISIQTISGIPLFSCTVGDLGHLSGVGDVSLDSWVCVERMMTVVKRTGHSSYYVEKGMGALGKTPEQMQLGNAQITGGAFPIWLENAPCCPIAVVACYSGSSTDDHHLVVTVIRDYLSKLLRPQQQSTPPPVNGGPVSQVPPPASTLPDWATETGVGHNRRSDSPYHHHEDD